MKNQVNMHPLIFAIAMVIAGVVGAGIVNYFKDSPPPIDKKLTYKPVGQLISVAVADAFYNPFANQNGPDVVRYITLSLDDLNDMNVVKQNAAAKGVDLKNFKLYYGTDIAGTFLMVSGVMNSDKLFKTVYKQLPNGEIGPCPYVCDAGSGLPPPTF